MICQFGTLAPRLLHLRKQNTDHLIDFQFPCLNFIKQKWKNQKHLHRELNRLGVKAYFRAGKVFKKLRRVTRKSTKTVYKCLNGMCTAELWYQKQNKKDSPLRVTKFDNLHQHIKSKDLEQSKREDINQFILNLDKAVYDNCETEKWKDNFDLTKTKALFVIERLLWQNNTEDQILGILANKDQVVLRRYRESGENGKTEIIFMCSTHMIQSYKIFGDTVSLGFTQSILTENSIFNQKYTIGCFYVHDENCRLLLVSCFVVMRQNQHNWKKLLQFFYECVCNNEDKIQTFVTDYLPDLENAILLFKYERDYQFQLLYDWLHVIQRFFKPQLSSLSNGKQIMEVFSKAFVETVHYKYDKILQTAEKMLGPSNATIMEDFKSKSHRFCFAKMARKFQSMSLSSTFASDVLTRTNKLPVYRNHTGRLFHKYLFIQEFQRKIANERVSDLKVAPIKYYSSELIFLREKMEKKILDLLVQKYAASKEFDRTQINSLTYRLFLDQQSGEGVIVRYSIEYGHWVCECNFIYMCGIPCQHILHMVNSMKGSIAYYINTRWYHTKQDKILAKTLPGAHISLRTRRRK